MVCVEGGDERVVAELSGAGRMPTFADLKARGAVVEFDTVGEVLSPCVWPSLISGQPAGNHAAAHFVQLESKEMRFQWRNEGDLEPFWLHLPDNGRGALALEVPECHPHPDSRADELCGWHASETSHPPYFSSSEIKRVVRSFGKLPELPDVVSRAPTHDQEVGLGRRLPNALTRWGQVAGKLIRDRPVSVVGIHETHTVLHWLGHHYLADHWARTSAADPSLVTAPYESLDAVLGSLLQGFEGNVAVVLAKGMRPANHAGHLLEGLLTAAGLLTRRGGDPRSEPGPGGEKAWITETARRLLPDQVRERIARRLPEHMQRRLMSRKFRDRYVWSETKAFPLPAWHTGFVQANVVGREGVGIVSPEERHAVLDEVTRLVLETVDADTGKPLAREVIRGPETFPGTRAHELPDLLVTWDGERPVRRARHPRFGEWEAEPESVRATEHKGGGTAFLAGPDVRPTGETVRVEERGLAPTMLALRAIRPPSIMVGGPWSDILA
ncbi:MAG: alkaline phosphatase family protein [Actinomycetota bacterium]